MTHPNGDGQDRKESTALASDRTMLASEKTLAAWWRTVIAALGAAIVLIKLYDHVRPIWIAPAAATLRSCLPS